MRTYHCTVWAAYGYVKVVVTCDPDTETEHVKAMAVAQAQRRAGGSLPFGYLSVDIDEWEDA